MKLAATVARSLHADMQAELRDIERAVTSGTREAGRGLRTELRRQVASAGLGQLPPQIRRSSARSVDERSAAGQRGTTLR